MAAARLAAERREVVDGHTAVDLRIAPVKHIEPERRFAQFTPYGEPDVDTVIDAAGTGRFPGRPADQVVAIRRRLGTSSAPSSEPVVQLEIRCEREDHPLVGMALENELAGGDRPRAIRELRRPRRRDNEGLPAVALGAAEALKRRKS